MFHAVKSASILDIPPECLKQYLSINSSQTDFMIFLQNKARYSVPLPVHFLLINANTNHPVAQTPSQEVILTPPISPSFSCPINLAQPVNRLPKHFPDPGNKGIINQEGFLPNKQIFVKLN